MFKEHRQKLPIWSYKDTLLSYFTQNQVTVLVGETGCGKSTQVPQYLPSNLSICVTQPRRVAAVTLARRVAKEQNVTLGQEVGYSVRFDDTTSSKTRIKFVTDGMLLREMMLDRSLSKYDVVILDEAHERSVASEVLTGLLKLLLVEKPTFKVIIMSATLHADSFSSFFNAPILSVEGRMFPVQTFYTPTPGNRLCRGHDNSCDTNTLG
ncbi:hypothetical protein GEMRC1_011410 [Eukaryota sp. GEM-RC1]